MRRTNTEALIRWLVTAAIMLSVPRVTAQKEDETPFRIHSSVLAVSNGKRWNHLGRQSRIMLLVGVTEGTALLAREIPGACGSEAERVIHQISVRGFHFSDIMQQIDAFYADTDNVCIPLVEAYGFALRKLKGATAAELDARLQHLRKVYNAR